MPSPISATSLEYSCSLCYSPLPNKNYPMPMPCPCLLPKTTPTYLPSRQNTTNFKTCLVMPKPRNCPHTAHTIEFIDPNAMPPAGTVYPITSPLELETLRQYCIENLNKGYIRHSQSPCGAPILFVKQSDGTLHICVDYRGLNELTKKNRYPLPQIGNLLYRLTHTKFFTKLDVRD